MLSQYGTPCTGCPVVARPRGDFRGDRPEGAVGQCRIGSSAAQRSPSSPRAGPLPPSCYAAGRRRRRRRAASVGRGRLSTDAQSKSRSRETVLRYPVSATAAGKPLRRKGRESFPSWTSPIRPRSPALRKGATCRGFSVYASVARKGRLACGGSRVEVRARKALRGRRFSR